MEVSLISSLCFLPFSANASNSDSRIQTTSHIKGQANQGWNGKN